MCWNARDGHRRRGDPLHVTNSAVLNDNLEDCIDYLMYLTRRKTSSGSPRIAGVHSEHSRGGDGSAP